MTRFYLEYIWLEEGHVRSKVKFHDQNANHLKALHQVPKWDSPYYDEKDGRWKLLFLRQVKLYTHPFHDQAYIVLCETMDSSGQPMWFNHRAKLRWMLENGGKEAELTLGYEQEYLIERDLGEIENIGKKGRKYLSQFYHGNGIPQGRDLADEHFMLSKSMGLCIQGYNCESIPNQWEYQIGQGSGKRIHPMDVCDDKVLALWLLLRLSEMYGKIINLSCKPLGDRWGGSGCHVNFETKRMREKDGIGYIEKKIIPLLRKHHSDHILCYGVGNENRLTGNFTTCSINSFIVGKQSDFSSCIRIPPTTIENGYGYLEDRRPASDSDGYLVAARIIATIQELPWTWTQELKDKMGYQIPHTE